MTDQSTRTLTPDEREKLSATKRETNWEPEALHNVYRGERLFIMGTGPSLDKITPEEWGGLRGKFVFGVNTFLMHPEAINLKLAEGWQLFGHPFAHNGEFFQAVVGKFETDKRLRKTTEDGGSA